MLKKRKRERDWRERSRGLSTARRYTVRYLDLERDDVEARLQNLRTAAIEEDRTFSAEDRQKTDLHLQRQQNVFPLLLVIGAVLLMVLTFHLLGLAQLTGLASFNDTYQGEFAAGIYPRDFHNDSIEIKDCDFLYPHNSNTALGETATVREKLLVLEKAAGFGGKYLCIVKKMLH